MKNSRHEIDIILDGIYCPRCRDLHPTLFWHNKYEDYIETKSEETWIAEQIQRAKRFGFECSEETAREMYLADKQSSPIYRAKESGKCQMCFESTHFVHKATGNYICSDECRYADHPDPDSLFHPLSGMHYSPEKDEVI